MMCVCVGGGGVIEKHGSQYDWFLCTSVFSVYARIDLNFIPA